MTTWTLKGNKTISLDEIAKAVEKVKLLEERVEKLEGEAMGLTPPEPAPLVVTCNGHSIELSDGEAQAFIWWWAHGNLTLPDLPQQNAVAIKLAHLLRDARQDPQPASDGPQTCPACDAPWQRTEMVGAARRGGGYRLRCHDCDHEWDDPNASHGQREAERRDTPQPERVDTASGIDFDALPDGTKLRHVRVHEATRIKADGEWWYPYENVLRPARLMLGNWEVVYQPAPLSPGECLRGLLAGRDDTDELIEYAKQWGGRGLTPDGRWRAVIGDAAREVHG